MRVYLTLTAIALLFNPIGLNGQEKSTDQIVQEAIEAAKMAEAPKIIDIPQIIKTIKKPDGTIETHYGFPGKQPSIGIREETTCRISDALISGPKRLGMGKLSRTEACECGAECDCDGCQCKPGYKCDSNGCTKKVKEADKTKAELFLTLNGKTYFLDGHTPETVNQSVKELGGGNVKFYNLQNQEVQTPSWFDAGRPLIKQTVNQGTTKVKSNGVVATPTIRATPVLTAGVNNSWSQGSMPMGLTTMFAQSAGQGGCTSGG